MTMEEYAKTLGETGALSGMSRNQFVEYVKSTYDKDALLIKPSLYFRLFTGPWNFLCTPFNKLLNWIGNKLPLYDAEGNPMSDKYIQDTVKFKMAGFIPLQDYGWHVVDAQPIARMEPKKFKRYFKSQCRAIKGMSKGKAVKFLTELVNNYKS